VDWRATLFFPPGTQNGGQWHDPPRRRLFRGARAGYADIDTRRDLAPTTDAMTDAAVLLLT
jgi:hypothetical protein